MDRPAAVVTELAHRLDLPENDSATWQLVKSHLDRQRMGTRAAPPAEYGSFGATPDGVRAVPSLARYMTEFDIPTEHLRTTVPRT